MTHTLLRGQSLVVPAGTLKIVRVEGQWVTLEVEAAAVPWEVLDKVNRLRMAACDPDGPVYGSNLVPLIDDVTTWILAGTPAHAPVAVPEDVRAATERLRRLEDNNPPWSSAQMDAVDAIYPDVKNQSFDIANDRKLLADTYLARHVLAGAATPAPPPGDEGEAWRPIESAPRGGKYFLACKGGVIVVGRMGTVTMRAGQKEQVEDCFRLSPGDLTWNPTHWMPLPAPPNPAALRRRGGEGG